MSKSKEWKERRAKYAPSRMKYALKRLEQVGINATQVDEFSLSFYFRCAKVTFFPYTGGVVGPTIKNTRGIEALIEQVKER